MDFNSFYSWAITQPWAFAVPFVALVLVDWGVGMAVAVKDGSFRKDKIFDWVQTTIGYKKAVAIAGSIAVAYFLNSQHDVYAALFPLVAVNGIAALSVLDDIRAKVVEFVKPAPKVTVVALPSNIPPS